MLKNRRKENDQERNQIQTQSQKRIVQNSHVTSGINNWLYPHSNYV